MVVMLVSAAVLLVILVVAGMIAFRPIVNSREVEIAARARAKASIASGIDAQASTMYLNAALAFREIETDDALHETSHLLRSDGPFWNSWAGDAIQS